MHETYNDRMPLFQPADDFEFRDPEIDCGWFTISLKCLGRDDKMTASYLSEPLRDFIDICNELHNYYYGDNNSDDSCEVGCYCEWRGEPWLYDRSFFV